MEKQPSSPQLKLSRLSQRSVSNRELKRLDRHTISRLSVSNAGKEPLSPSSTLCSPTSNPPPSPPGGWLSDRMSVSHEMAFNAMIAFLQIIPQSTLTIVFPTSKVIAKSFSISDPSILPWLIAAYALTWGTFILISGRLGDIFGHKKLVVTGFGFMSLCSAAVGLSHYTRSEVFFVARALQGVAASMMAPNGLALLGRTYSPTSKKKIFAFTIFGLCAPIGAYMGMLFGALFAQLLSWWWSYYTLAGVTAFLALAAQFILLSPPPTPKQMAGTTEKLRDMDWLGAVFAVSGLVLTQFSLVSAPTKGWDSPNIYFVLIIGVLLILFFVITEIKIAEQPLVPFKMLNARVSFVLGAVACGWGTFGVWTWYLWRWFLHVQLYEPFEAALHALPIVPTSLISSAVAVLMLRKVSPSWVLLTALAAFTTGCVLLAFNTVDQAYWTFTFLSLLITPWGMNLSFSSATIIISNFFPPQQQGLGGSLITTVVNYSISLGLGFASTVEVNVNRNGADILHGIRGGFYFGIGLGGLGTIICAALVIKTVIHSTNGKQGEEVPTVTMRSSTAAYKRQPSDRKFSRASTLVSHKPLMKHHYPYESDEMMLVDKSETRPGTAYTNETQTLPTTAQTDGTQTPREPEPVCRSDGSFENFDFERHFPVTQAAMLTQLVGGLVQKKRRSDARLEEASIGWAR